ncbi:MAG: asparagine synthase-related protein [Caulobacteraceae bacterium]
MSGLFGIVNLDGRPVDEALLGALTARMDFRGPDGRGLATSGQAGFGHTLLRATAESAEEAQPIAFDDGALIVADARIDARAELAAALRAAGQAPRLDRPDVELILAAWRAWGEDCVTRLIGDFAFAVWDGRRLFLARDQMGVKPLYFAEIGRTVVFGNTPACLRAHPGFPVGFDERALAEYLLYGTRQDETATGFAGLKRLPPAHTRAWDADGAEQRRYWTLPIEEPVYRRRAQDYLDEFSSLLTTVVADRLRVPRAGLLMSGGLDSTTLAMEMCDQLSLGGAVNVAAFTAIFGSDDEEARFAKMVGERPGLSLHFVDRSVTACEEPLDALDDAVAGPDDLTLDPRPLRAQYADMTRFSRVAMFGEGPDNALPYEWRAHLAFLAGQGRWLRAATDLVLDRIADARPPAFATLRHRVSGAWAEDERDAIPPSILRPEAAVRLGIDPDHWPVTPVDWIHPARPSAHRSLQTPLWSSLFEGLDPAVTGASLEFRHPYVDVRMLRFLLTVPPLPWARRKLLVRRAMRGRLPPAVLARDKTPLARHFSTPDLSQLPSVTLEPEARALVREDWAAADPRAVVRARTLNRWLRLAKLAADSPEQSAHDPDRP